jgi:diguanylate cyclase (GGDEF)-like protein
LTSAFAADECVIILPEQARCYATRALPDELIADLAPLCETVCQFATAVVTPPRPGGPYRSFLGLSLSQNNAPPLALLMLCREACVPFGRDVAAHLRILANRLSAELSWRLVHDRLLADRDRLRELSRVDPVLGVANRTALQEELSRLVMKTERRGEPISVAVIDIDGLRLINERNGYPAGDAVLAHVAQVARREARAQDIVARYAGDSVAIVMPGATMDEASTMLTGILGAIDAIPVVHEERSINLTVSAGVAEVRYDSETGEATLARAMAARARAHLHGEVIALADESVADVPAHPDFAIGTTLGGVYQIRHEINRGAFGVVYRAEDLALGRQVALKLLRPDIARDTAFVDRFRAEAATLARIRNPNLVQVYTFGVDDLNVFFAMELVEGQGLDKRIHTARARRRHIPLSEVIGIIDEVAGALEAVHRAGMLHRDVKPENVLIDRVYKRCVLVDVGIAVRRGAKEAAGTPGFTAPEVWGTGTETTATDVYSLGALAYILLTLEAPFAGASPLEILELQMRHQPRRLTDIRRDLPAAVDDVLLPTLDPDPSRRPQSARELAKALSSVLAKPNVSPRSTMERPAVEPPPERRSLSGQGLSARSVTPRTPSTRGILFRAAYEVLGARRGSVWIADASRRFPELALALAPETPALAWHPTSAFVSLLESLSKDELERRTIARQLGRSAVESSFGQFYGAEPSAVWPADVLRAVDLFWRCYHSWGVAAVIARDTDADLTLSDGIGNALVCASTAGLLTGVVARAGGLAVNVHHGECVAEGAKRCAFRLTWELAPDNRTTM